MVAMSNMEVLTKVVFVRLAYNISWNPSEADLIWVMCELMSQLLVEFDLTERSSLGGLLWRWRPQI